MRHPNRCQPKQIERWVFPVSFILGLCLLLFAPDLHAKSLMEKGLSSESFVSGTTGTWQLSAEQISYDKKQNVYEAAGKVVISSGDRSLQADWARLDLQKQEADLKGNVQLRYGRDWLKGEHVVWNLQDETGRVDGGLIYFDKNHFYIQGRLIAKTGPSNYQLEDGYLTTCDPENPDWKIKYKSMKVNTEGFAWAKHTSFWAKSMPLVYTPLVGLPVDRDRQSGLLLPWAGVSSLNGIEGEQPFYWAIRQDMDMTFYGRYMQDRGWMSGAEYRIANKTLGEGIWLGNYLRDQASKEHLAEYDYSYIKSDKYWVRSRHSLDLPLNIEGKLDLDIVSDKNYLKEFKNGSTSYDYTNDIFTKFFGRGVLNDDTITARENTLYLNRRGDSSLIYLDAIYWDQLDRSIDEYTLQRLPELSFNMAPNQIDRLPLYYNLETSGIYYYREEGDKGYRLNLYPRLSYPLHWKTYLDLQPSVGVNSTSYRVDWQENSRDNWQQRTLTDIKLEMTSRLNRVYGINVGNYVAMQHAVRPELMYEYMPKVNQADLPKFDSIDDIDERHGITYGITNFLMGKASQVDAQGQSAASYKEFARLQVYQTLNIRKAATPETDFSTFETTQVSYDSDDTSEAEKTRFTPLNLLLDIYPGRYITLTYDTQVATEEGNINRQDLYATLDSGKGYYLRAGYQFFRGTAIDELIMEAGIKLLSNFYLSTYHDYSFDKQELFKQGYGLKYQHGCWGIGLTYRKEGNDNSFAFSIDLLGLGRFSGS